MLSLRPRSFWLRYYLFLLVQKLGSVNKFGFPTLLVIFLVIGFLEIIGIDLYFAQIGILAAIFAYIAYQFLSPLFYTIKNGKLARIMDKYGYSEELLKAYEKARILNKPFDLTRSAQFAEIYVYIGQSEKAVEYLGSITLPKTPRRFEMVEYLRVYILALLKCGELEKAEELWAENSYYINRMKTIKDYSPNVGSVFLTEIYIECYAAFKGDESRLQRAYELTTQYLDSQKANGKSHLNGFDIILVYELRALGKTEEADRFYPAALDKIDRYMSLFDFSRKIELQELEKAANGVLPFLD